MPKYDIRVRGTLGAPYESLGDYSASGLAGAVAQAADSLADNDGEILEILAVRPGTVLPDDNTGHKECPTCGGLPIDIINGVCNACRMEGAKYRPTNIDLVVDLMNYSKFGALSQVFIMEAITRYAEQMAQATPEQLTPKAPEDGQEGISMGFPAQAWIGVAKDIQARLEARDCGPCGVDQ